MIRKYFQIYAIDLDWKNGNRLWEKAIETKLKQLTEYQTFIAFDSEENISNGYQKIPYHLVFDVMYDLRYKATTAFFFDLDF